MKAWEEPACPSLPTAARPAWCSDAVRDDSVTLALTVGLGLLIGLSLGALGGGGSILTVPALVYALGEGCTVGDHGQPRHRRDHGGGGGPGPRQSRPRALASRFWFWRRGNRGIVRGHCPECSRRSEPPAGLLRGLDARRGRRHAHQDPGPHPPGSRTGARSRGRRSGVAATRPPDDPAPTYGRCAPRPAAGLAGRGPPGRLRRHRRRLPHRLSRRRRRLHHRAGPRPPADAKIPPIQPRSGG